MQFSFLHALRRVSLLGALTLGAAQTHSISAQNTFVPASTAEQGFGGTGYTTGFRNTGCDNGASEGTIYNDQSLVAYAFEGGGGNNVRVSVRYSSAYATPLTAPTTPLILTGPAGHTQLTDPDIVVNQVATQGAATWDMMVVYLATVPGLTGNHVYAELLSYTRTGAGAGTLTSTAVIRVDNAAGACTSPNADASKSLNGGFPSAGESFAGVTWEQGNSVFLTTRSMTATNFTGAGAFTAIRTIATGGTATLSSPDVAVNRVLSGGGTPIVYVDSAFVCYASNAGGAGFAIVASTPFISGNLSYIKRCFSYQCDAVSFTRIAATTEANGEWAMVFIDTPAGTPVVGQGTLMVRHLSYNAYNWFSGGTCTVQRPAVTYGTHVTQTNAAAPHIITAWTDANGCISGSGNSDIVSMRFYIDGTATPSYLDYFGVNSTLTGTQVTPALCDRFLINTNMGTHYMWLDLTVPRVEYVSSLAWNNGAVRPGHTTAGPDKVASSEAAIAVAAGADSVLAPGASRVTLYPNPVVSTSKVAMQLPAGETVQAMEVIDLTTGRYVSRVTGNKLADASTGLAVRDLLPEASRSGLYLLRLTTSAGTFNTRFEYQMTK